MLRAPALQGVSSKELLKILLKIFLNHSKQSLSCPRDPETMLLKLANPSCLVPARALPSGRLKRVSDLSETFRKCCSGVVDLGEFFGNAHKVCMTRCLVHVRVVCPRVESKLQLISEILP